MQIYFDVMSASDAAKHLYIIYNLKIYANILTHKKENPSKCGEKQTERNWRRFSHIEIVEHKPWLELVFDWWERCKWMRNRRNNSKFRDNTLYISHSMKEEKKGKDEIYKPALYLHNSCNIYNMQRREQ